MNLPGELVWLVQEKRAFRIDERIIIRAIEQGHSYILREAEKVEFNLFTFYYFTTAVRANQSAIVEWMLAHKQEEWIVGGINVAAKCGHLDLIKLLHGKLRSCEDCTEWALDSAAEFGHLDVLDWLQEHCSAQCSTRAMDWAAAKGQIQALTWLKAHHYSCTEWASELARRFNQPAAIQWLRDNQVYVD